MSDKDELPLRIFLRAYDWDNWREAMNNRAVDWDDQPDARAKLNAEYVRGNGSAWISVDERLPEKGSTVLIWDGEWAIARYDSWRCTEAAPLYYPDAKVGIILHGWDQPRDEEYSRYSPTHWMPLPGPPQ